MGDAGVGEVVEGEEESGDVWVERGEGEGGKEGGEEGEGAVEGDEGGGAGGEGTAAEEAGGLRY